MSDYQIPWYSVDSGQPGPGLLIHAGRHGNEVSGAEVARRFLSRARRELLCGKVVVVPVADPLALHQRQYAYEPTPGAGAQYGYWPGRPDGDEAERQAYHVRQAIEEEKLDHCLDVHCGEPACASWVIERAEYPRACELAEVCGFRFIREGEPLTGTPAGWFNHTGRVGITLELSGTYEIVEREVRRGLQACVNVARHLAMMPGEVELQGPSLRVRPEELVAIRAPQSGLYAATRLRPGDYCREGQTVARLLRECDWAAVALKAPSAGYLYALGPNRPGAHNSLQARHAYVEKDEVLAQIAVFATPDNPVGQR